MEMLTRGLAGGVAALGPSPGLRHCCRSGNRSPIEPPQSQPPGVTVQLPIALAANLCDVTVDVLVNELAHGRHRAPPAPAPTPWPPPRMAGLSPRKVWSTSTSPTSSSRLRSRSPPTSVTSPSRCWCPGSRMVPRRATPPPPPKRSPPEGSLPALPVDSVVEELPVTVPELPVTLPTDS